MNFENMDMDITSQITVSIKPELYQSVSELSLFKPGRTLLLKVLELRGDRALIDFGTFRASADIKVPVTIGDELMVRVQESGQQLKLALVNGEQVKTITNESPSQLRADTGDPNNVQILSDLKRILNPFFESQTAKTIPKNILNKFSVLSVHFQPFDLEKIVAEIMPQLKSYVDNSGFFFEKILENGILNLKDETDTALPKQLANHPDIQGIVSRDLKANLLAVKHAAGDEASLEKAFDARSLATLRRAADLLLADINNQQGRAVKQLDTPEPFQVFTYALPLTEEGHSAKLKIYYQKKRRAGSKNGIQVSLLLSMDRLGNLRTDFYLLDKDLTVTFFVKDRLTRKKIDEYKQVMTESLIPLFNQVRLQVTVSEKKINDFDVEDNQINSERRVDLRV